MSEGEQSQSLQHSEVRSALVSTAIPILVGPFHLAVSVYVCHVFSLCRPNTGRSYFEEKREDLLHKYSQIDAVGAGESVTASSFCVNLILALTLVRHCHWLF